MLKICLYEQPSVETQASDFTAIQYVKSCGVPGENTVVVINDLWLEGSDHVVWPFVRASAQSARCLTVSHQGAPQKRMK
ncbi:hypothetical protein FGIG_01505 [Fasciola gigantica]|uniref:Uncharacterized protein n=1 Tax=Fasciola gigantica TaxID=46835 RepID=A0A504YMR3_FASGI|nr:hypothetical protein FGIG_01505 [Fasciola gigantica]